MTLSFLVRSLDVQVDASTCTRRPSRSRLKIASGQVTIDVGQALHMLGTLTMPNILSPASPALFWAWLRYYLAPTAARDLRITIDFSDLDPHQKGILSDDFGVALATQWISDRIGPFAKIVDGRRFANQLHPVSPEKAKIEGEART